MTVFDTVVFYVTADYPGGAIKEKTGYQSIYSEVRMSKKIQVSFSDKQIDLLDKLKGEFGETDADVVRNVVLAWLSEKGFISTVIKQRISQESEQRLNNERA